jgi:hypothetical protein
LRQAYSLDLRSLALFRIGLGIVILGDLIARAQADGLRAFYSDMGVLPPQILVERFGWSEFWSIHIASGSLAFEALLFVVAAIFAVLLIVGYRTRLATIVSWLLLVSLHSRNPFVLHGGDTLLRLLLFWAMFLPLGKRFSVDAVWDLDEVEGPRSAPFVPSLAFLAQMVCVYLFAFLLKTGPEWKDGSALQYALSIEQMATPFGQFLLDHPAWLPVLTVVARYAELAVAILILAPWQRARTIVAFAVLTLQLGFAFSLRVGHFPFVAAVGALALLPQEFWNRIAKVKTEAGPPEPLDTNLFLRIAAIAAIAVILILNLATLGWFSIPRPVAHIANLLRLDQEWNMFAPSPREPDGWYVIIGESAGGTSLDAWRMHSLSTDPWRKPAPAEMNAQYPSERWAVYMMDLHKPEMRPHLPLFAKYLCHRVNDALARSGGARLAAVHIYFVERLDQLNRSAAQPLERRLLLQHTCE